MRQQARQTTVEYLYALLSGYGGMASFKQTETRQRDR